MTTSLGTGLYWFVEIIISVFRIWYWLDCWLLVEGSIFVFGSILVETSWIDLFGLIIFFETFWIDWYWLFSFGVVGLCFGVVELWFGVVELGSGNSIWFWAFNFEIFDNKNTMIMVAIMTINTIIATSIPIINPILLFVWDG